MFIFLTHRLPGYRGSPSLAHFQEGGSITVPSSVVPLKWLLDPLPFPEGNISTGIHVFPFPILLDI